MTSLMTTDSGDDSVSPNTILLVLLIKKLLSQKAQSNLFRRHHMTYVAPDVIDVTAMNRQRRDADDDVRPPSRSNPFEKTRLNWKILKTRDGRCVRIRRNGKNGRSGIVDGTTDATDLNVILEFKAVGVGLVHIRGVESGMYLTMDSRGRLTGQQLPTNDAIFHERIIENKYSLYSATRRKSSSTCFVTLHRNRSGCTLTPNHRHAHFLPYYIKHFDFIKGHFE